MHEFINFLLRHYVLSSLFVILLLSVFVYEAMNQGYGSRISVQDLVSGMNAGTVSVFDIRANSTFADGHILDSKCVTADDLRQENGPLSGLAEKRAVIVCANGQKSGVLVAKLKTQFKSIDLVLLAGGVDAWSKQNMPLKKGKK
jgi:rhodanese-related sulfurtransferase